MAARRVLPEILGRSPAVCLLGHMHHFAPDGGRYAISRDGVRIGMVVLSRRFGCEDVRECLVCGAPLVTVEG